MVFKTRPDPSGQHTYTKREHKLLSTAGTERALSESPPGALRHGDPESPIRAEHDVHRRTGCGKLTPAATLLSPLPGLSAAPFWGASCQQAYMGRGRRPRIAFLGVEGSSYPVHRTRVPRITRVFFRSAGPGVRRPERGALEGPPCGSGTIRRVGRPSWNRAIPYPPPGLPVRQDAADSVCEGAPPRALPRPFAAEAR
jgi:hypothetical protein